MLTLKNPSGDAAHSALDFDRPTREAPPQVHLTITPEATLAMSQLARTRGPQAVLASWPGGATYLPAAQYAPGRYDIVIGYAGGCPIYADVRQVGYYAERHVVLDVSRMSSAHGRPILLLRNVAVDTRTATR